MKQKLSTLLFSTFYFN